MQTSNPLSEEAVLAVLRQIQAEGRPPPSLREIARQVGHRTTVSVQRILDRLERQGLISRQSGKSRSVQLTDKAQPRRGLVIWGRIAAGPLSEAVDDEELFDLEEYSPETHRGLRVRGESMIEAHILDGDIAVIRLQPTCRDGDIVAAVVDGEATLKRFFRKKDHILLQPENRRMEPIRVTEVEIRGVMVGLIRRF